MTDLDLTHIAEALVIHPGDRVLIRVKPDAEYGFVQTFAEQLRERLSSIDVDVTVIAGADQIAVIRHEEADE